ncbi:MAG: hypothetical protein ACRDOM_08570 [Nocardioides sp.]
MSQPGYDRSEDQILQERAASAVSDVLLNLEWTIEAARKGHKLVAKDGVDANAELALAALIQDLDRLRKRFTQDTIYAIDNRLI